MVSNMSSNEVNFESESQIVDTQPAVSVIMSGVVAFVDVRSTDGSNRSAVVRDKLVSLGATVVPKLSSEVTHIIFKDGLKSTFLHAKRRAVFLVSCTWIECSQKAGKRLPEAMFPSVSLEKYSDPTFLSRLKKGKSMQPKEFSELEVAVEERLKRRRQRLTPASSSNPSPGSNSPFEGELLRSPAFNYCRSTTSCNSSSPLYGIVHLLSPKRPKDAEEELVLRSIPQRSPLINDETIGKDNSIIKALQRSGPAKLSQNQTKSSDQQRKCIRNKLLSRVQQSILNDVSRNIGAYEPRTPLTSEESLSSESDAFAIEGSLYETVSSSKVQINALRRRSCRLIAREQANSVADKSTITQARRESFFASPVVNDNIEQKACPNASGILSEVLVESKSLCESSFVEVPLVTRVNESDTSSEKFNDEINDSLIRRFSDDDYFSPLAERLYNRFVSSRRRTIHQWSASPVLSGEYRPKSPSLFSDHHSEQIKDVASSVFTDNNSQQVRNETTPRRSPRRLMVDNAVTNLESISPLVFDDCAPKSQGYNSGEFHAVTTNDQLTDNTPGTSVSSSQGSCMATSVDSGVASGRSFVSSNLAGCHTDINSIKLQTSQKRASCVYDSSVESSNIREHPRNVDKKTGANSSINKRRRSLYSTEDMIPEENLIIPETPTLPSSFHGNDPCQLYDDLLAKRNNSEKGKYVIGAKTFTLPRPLKNNLKEVALSERKVLTLKENENVDNNSCKNDEFKELENRCVQAESKTHIMANRPISRRRSSVNSARYSVSNDNSSSNNLNNRLCAKHRQSTSTNEKCGQDMATNGLKKQTRRYRRPRQLAQSLIVDKLLPGLCFTSIHSREIEVLYPIVQGMGGFNIRRRADETVTHLVSGDSSRRTVNMLLACLRGAKLVSPKWIYESLQAERWLKERDYAVPEYSAVAETVAEMNRMGERVHLLSSVGKIYVDSETAPPAQDLKELITLAGGLVSTNRRTATVIISPAHKPLSNSLLGLLKERSEMTTVTDICSRTSTISYDVNNINLPRLNSSALRAVIDSHRPTDDLTVTELDEETSPVKFQFNCEEVSAGGKSTEISVMLNCNHRTASAKFIAQSNRRQSALLENVTDLKSVNGTALSHVHLAQNSSQETSTSRSRNARKNIARNCHNASSNVSEDSTDCSQFLFNGVNTAKLVIVNEKWLLDCIQQFTLLPFDDYIICDNETLVTTVTSSEGPISISSKQKTSTKRVSSISCKRSSREVVAQAVTKCVDGGLSDAPDQSLQNVPVSEKSTSKKSISVVRVKNKRTSPSSVEYSASESVSSAPTVTFSTEENSSVPFVNMRVHNTPRQTARRSPRLSSRNHKLSLTSILKPPGTTVARRKSVRISLLPQK